MSVATAMDAGTLDGRVPSVLPVPALAPFPTERFLAFCAQLRIQTKDFGVVPLELIGTQRYVLAEMKKAMLEGVSTFVILKARQLGMTTFFIALDLFWAMEHKGLLGAFVTHTDQSKAQFRNIIKVFLAGLPKTHKIAVGTENRDMLILKNGSIFQYLVAGVKEKSKGGIGRSSANNYKHMTESAFYGSPDDIDELNATMSTHYPHRLEVDESTANGFNHFHDRWEAAKTDPTICAIFVGWWLHDHYAFANNHPYFRIYMPDGHATPLHPLERKRCRAVKERYGVEITRNQIAWYRWRLEAKTGGDQGKMDELFPWLEEDAFVATGSKFFANESLTDANRRARKIPFLPYRYVMSDRWQDTGIVAASAKQAELKIWEEAHPHGHYVIGDDPAFGSSDTADRSCIHVARCFADRLVQVAEFNSPSVSTYQNAWVLAHLAGYFGNVMVNLEITGPGTAVFQRLEDLRREIGEVRPGDPDLRSVLAAMRHFLYRRVDSLQGSLAYQWRMTHDNKRAMLNGMKDSFELHRFILNSLPLLEEMKSIVVEDGTIEAAGRGKDDRVIAAGLAHEAWRMWVRPKLLNMGITYEKAYASENGGKPDQVSRMALDYLRQAGISVAKETK